MRRYFDVAKETFKEFGQDKAPRLGAALSYYTIFSVGPLLLIAISMAGIFLGEEAAQGRISDQLRNVLGSEAAKSIEQIVEAAARPESGAIATIVGLATLLFGASGVFAQLKDAMNTIWNVEAKKAAGVVGFVKQRFLSMAMVLGIGFLLLVTLLFDAAISAMGDYAGQFVGGEPLMQALQFVVSFALITVLFAAIFRILPDLDVQWSDVWVGAGLTALLFVLGKFALGLYLGKAAIGSSYGAAGSLVVLLVWVYWSAQILFLGAEFTQVYTRRYGSLAGDTSKQEARAQAARPEDRPRAEETAAGMRVPGRPLAGPVPAAAREGRTRGGGAITLAAGGVAGLFVGAIVGGVGAMAVVLKTARKLLLPFK